MSLSEPAEPAVRESSTGSAYLLTYRDGLSHENRLLAFLRSPASDVGLPPTAREAAVSARRPAHDTFRRFRLSAADLSSSSRDAGRHAAERPVPAPSHSYRQISPSPVGHSHRSTSPTRSAPHAPRAPPAEPLSAYSTCRTEAALSERALARHYRSQSKETGGGGGHTSASKESVMARDPLRLPSSMLLRGKLDARERERQARSRPLTTNASSATRESSSLAAESSGPRLHTRAFYEATRELRSTRTRSSKDVPDTRTGRSDALQLASHPQPEGVSSVQRPHSFTSHSPVACLERVDSERASIQLSSLRSSDAGSASQRSDQRLGAASSARDKQRSRSFYEPNSVQPPESGAQIVFVPVNTTPVLRNASALAAQATFDSQQPLDMLSTQPLLFRAFPANPLLAFESQGVLSTRAVERERVARLRRAAISAGALERRATPRISDSVSELVSSCDVDRDARALWEQMRHTEAESARQAPAPGKGILKKSCSLLALDRPDAEALELPLVGHSEPPSAADELCAARDSADEPAAPLADPQQRPTEDLCPDDVCISVRLELQQASIRDENRRYVWRTLQVCQPAERNVRLFIWQRLRQRSAHLFTRYSHSRAVPVPRESRTCLLKHSECLYSPLAQQPPAANKKTVRFAEGHQTTYIGELSNSIILATLNRVCRALMA